MDEIDFLRGVEGEIQNGEDLVIGAEHFVRLKKQVGLTRPSDTSLELEKDAGELAESLATPQAETCKGCGKVKTSCMCKTATLSDILQSARIKTAGRIESSNDSLFSHLSTKLADMREKTAGSVLERLKDVNPGLVAATGLGALAGGLGTYLSSRPQKDSGKSKAEEELEGHIESQKQQPERGLLSKMHHRNTELEHGYARAFREHPAGAAAIGTATGAMGGYGIGRLAGALTRMRGGK